MTKFLSGLRVLVVEDEMMVLMSIEAVLADLGCDDVSVAATVDDALGLIAARVFDVAMLDVNLDGQTSYPIADALALRDVPFVFSTGYGGRGIDKVYADRPVLNKPYSDNDLTAALSNLITGSDCVAA